MQENATAENVYKFSSTLSPSDPSYVDRRADLELYQALMNSQYCYIFNSRKMGKSSLTVRIREHLTYAMSINTYSSQKLENLQLDHKEK